MAVTMTPTTTDMTITATKVLAEFGAIEGEIQDVEIY